MCNLTQLLLICADNPYEGHIIQIIVFQGESDVAFLRARYKFILCTLLLAGIATTSQAGVFESINPVTAAPVRWMNPQAIPYNLDDGTLGQLNAQQAQDLVEAMMAVWENEGGGAIHFVNQGSLGIDVDSNNMKDFVNGSVCASNIPPKIASMIKGQSPIIFDNDGSIIDAMSGEGSSRRIVGKAAFRCFKGTLGNPEGATQAFLILNGRFIDGLPDPIDLPVNVYAGVVLHELGHYLGLHHSMVNSDIYEDVLEGKRPSEDSKYIPVMYPLILPNSIASTVLKPDDTSILQTLYPTSDQAPQGVASGTIVGTDNEPTLGANVVARRSDDPLCQAISTVSGRECTPMIDSFNNPNVLSEKCSSKDQFGNYKIRGLSEGDYTVEVNEIVEAGGGRSNMFPKGLGQDLPGEPQIIPSPIRIAGSEVRELNFKLTPAVEEHQTGIDMSIFMRASQSECHLDPVNYSEFLAVGNSSLVDSSSSSSAPAPSATPTAGCSLIR
ncbi:MAG: hypothetical protein COV45_06235 [Deltaproteobacteria bacterium CG11_big_fil_rev_8_21_14_0_20_47_16]|nr:MAG: hypothetical protein COV45_06235 [Deltaproteobacteria bacterium CG11_big_fil_rev_8_21_14_0_20_47_16]